MLGLDIMHQLTEYVLNAVILRSEILLKKAGVFVASFLSLVTSTYLSPILRNARDREAGCRKA